MTGTFELANQLAILSVGRYPAWVEQTGDADTPDAANDGAYLSNSVQALLAVAVREVAAARSARFTVTNHVAGQTYTVTVGGNAVAYVSGALDTIDDVMDGLIAALPGVPAADALVTFTGVDTDGDGAFDELLIRGKDTADYTIDGTATGAATVAVVADARDCDVRLWARPRGATVTGSTTGAAEPADWYAINSAEYAVTWRGFLERFEVAGLSRMHAEIYNVSAVVGDGVAVTYATPAYWGPAIEEP